MPHKRILVIAPHMDDEVLGCGGTIARHIDNGDSVSVLFVAHRVYNHQFNQQRNEIERKHAIKAKQFLGYQETVFLDLCDERLDGCIQDIIMPLEKFVSKIEPDAAYCPFYGDNNQDHRAVFDAARVVLRPAKTPFLINVFMYEVPSSTEQSPPLTKDAFLPNYYVDITEQMDKKIKAYRAYRTEKRPYPHPRSEKALKILAAKRGTEMGFKYAEAFMILRHKWC